MLINHFDSWYLRHSTSAKVAHERALIEARYRSQLNHPDIGRNHEDQREDMPDVYMFRSARVPDVDIDQIRTESPRSTPTAAPPPVKWWNPTICLLTGANAALLLWLILRIIF